MSDPKIYVDLDYLQSIFDRLEVMDVELDPDPVAFGPLRLTEKISVARKFLSDTERIFIDLANRLRLLTSLHRHESTKFELLIKNDLANNPEVRANRNVADRMATATMLHRELQEDVYRMKDAILQMETTLVSVKSKRADLKDLQSRIRDQIKLCQEEIGLGGEWGSRSPSGSSLPKPQGDGSANAVDTALASAGEDDDELFGLVEGWGVDSEEGEEETEEEEGEPETETEDEEGETEEEEGETEEEEEEPEAAPEPKTVAEEVLVPEASEQDEDPEEESQDDVVARLFGDSPGADVLDFPSEEIASDPLVTNTDAESAEAFLDLDSLPAAKEEDPEDMMDEDVDIDDLLAKF